MEQLLERVRTRSTATIVATAKITPCDTVEARMVRAALLTVYEEREGEEALDALLDELESGA